MKYLISFFIIFSNVYAIDYGLCKKFLDQNKHEIYMTLDNKGNITANHKEVDLYQEDNKRKSFKIEKSGFKTPNGNTKLSNQETVKAEIIKKDDGSMVVNYTSQRNPGELKGSPISGQEPLYYNEKKMMIVFQIKNGKCFPEEVRNEEGFINPLSNTKESSVRVSSSKICRKILDFFKRREDRNYSVTELKELRSILINADIASSEEIEKLPKVDRIDIAANYLQSCKDFGLEETMKSDDLWAEPFQFSSEGEPFSGDKQK